ncbi:MAG: hypothetical protein IPO58_18505 [Betaproteobacteria bacterium]|nr:hypothetical protein [Betaproteobacteria bacterium]
MTFTVVPGSVTVATNGAGCNVTPPPPTTDTGLNNTATVTMTGGPPTPSNVCAPTPPALVVVKSDPVVVGTTATYTVTVTNTGGTAATYELTDSPLFGAGVTVTAPPVCTNTSVLPGVGDTTPTCTTTTGPWALADPGTAIAAAVAVPVVDSYTVAVPFTVDNTSTPASRTCPAVGSFTATGLNNGATLTVAGTTSSDPGCANAPPPALVTHVKTITAGPVLVGPNQYTISYQIDVTNSGGVPGGYQLDETPHFGAGVVINSATCASSLAAGTGTPDLTPCTAAPAPIVLVNGTPFNLATAGTTIDVATTHRYALVVTFTVVPGSVTVATNGATCNATPPPPTTNTGLNNTASLTVTGTTTTSNVCTPTPPALVVVKSDPSVVGTTATYTITVTNSGGAGTYALSDSPLFGAGITVTAPPGVHQHQRAPGRGRYDADVHDDHGTVGAGRSGHGDRGGRCGAGGGQLHRGDTVRRRQHHQHDAKPDVSGGGLVHDDRVEQRCDADGGGRCDLERSGLR